MSAQRLRDAAKVLRDLVEAVPESPWHAVHLNGEHLYMEAEDHTWMVDSGPSFICDLNGDHAGRAEVATFIATMHPGVALALADLLEFLVGFSSVGMHGLEDEFLRNALHLADLILGGSE